MLARQADIDSNVHAQGSAVRYSVLYSPEPWPWPIFISSAAYDNSGTLGEAGLSADSVTGHIFAGVSKHGPGMYILRPVLGDMQPLHASPAQPNQWNALRRLGSNSASAKAGLLLLVSSARYGGGLYLTGLVWMLL